MNTNELICGYDGFKLFIPGDDAISYLINNSEKFHLYGRYSVHDQTMYELPLQGYYGDEYKIRISATMIKGLGQGVELTGSFHKFYNSGKNDNIFLWSEFINCLELLHELFPFDANRIHLINLEIGLNITLPTHWPVTAKEIVRKIVTYKGKFTNRQDINHKEKGYFLQYTMTEYFLKIYDKSMQYGHEEGSILRYELKIKKSSYLKDRGISLLSDLTDAENQTKLFNELTGLFEHLVIYQDEVKDVILLPDENVFCREYNRPSDWEDLHNIDVHKYKYVKKALEKITEEHCIINYKRRLQELLSIAIENPVPEFPL